MILNKFPGKFIVFEGIDFAGKSSQCKRLEQWLEAYARRLKCTFTREPTHQYYGKVIRSILGSEALFNQIPKPALQTLYAVDSRQHMRDLVISQLKEGVNVISDRYRPSSIAYGSNTEEELQTFYKINEVVLGKDFIWPDLIIWLDIPVEVSMERKAKSGRRADAFENRRTLERIRSNYQKISERYPNFKKVSAEGDPKEVFVRVRDVFVDFLKQK